MENVHRFGAPGEVDHAVSAARIRDAKLLDTPADTQHRFEVIGLIAALDLVGLITPIVPGVLWEVPQAFEGIAQEAHRPHELIISDWI